jgi:hypothetical protein
MKPDALWIRLPALFVFVAAAYFTAFNWIEHRRHVHGGWEVTFSREAGVPSLAIAQKSLHISDCKIRFPGGAVTNLNLPQTVVFDAPDKTIPFGVIPFSDLTFLPGTVTFKLFGHTVELVPRVLGIDGREQAWFSGPPLDLPARAKKSGE